MGEDEEDDDDEPLKKKQKRPTGKAKAKATLIGRVVTKWLGCLCDLINLL